MDVMAPTMPPEPRPDDLAACATHAVRRAAEELGTGALELAQGLQHGEIAELVEELRIARSLYFHGQDRARVDDLLGRVGVLDGGGRHHRRKASDSDNPRTI
jgi:hypothetical protein